MNTKTLVPIIFSFLFFSCNTSIQKQPENDLSEKGLKGNVKFYKETKYKPIETLGKIEKGHAINIAETNFNNEGNLIDQRFFSYETNFTSKTIYSYNEKGSLIKVVEEYGKNGELKRRNRTYNYDKKEKLIEEKWYNKEKKIESKRTYNYDKKGNLIEESYWSDEGNFIYQTTYYIYDNKGNLIENYSKGEKLKGRIKNTYEYDEKGNEIEGIFYFNGIEERKWYNRYDEKENLIEEEAFLFKGENVDKAFSYRTTHKYDTKGNIIETISYSGESVEWKEYFKYNEEGNLVEKISFDNLYKNFEDNSTQIFYNKYDEKGNWTEMIEFTFSSPDLIIEREIEYY